MNILHGSCLALISAGAAAGSELCLTGAFEPWADGGELAGVLPGDQRNVDAVPFGNGFALVYDDTRGGSDENIGAAFLDGAGRQVSPPIEVSRAEGDEKRPAAVEVAGRLFVVWEDNRDNVFTQLRAAFVDPDGAVAPAAGFALSSADADQSDVELAVLDGVVLAVWEELVPGGGPMVMGSRFDGTGAPIDPVPFGFGPGLEPALVAGEDRFLVAYQTYSERIEGRFVAASPGAEPLVGEALAMVSTERADEPSLAFGGGHYALSWIREMSSTRVEALAARRFGIDGAAVDGEEAIRLIETDEEAEHEIAWGGDAFWIAASLGGRERQGGYCGVAEIDWAGATEFETVSAAANRVQDPAIAVGADGVVLAVWEDQIWEGSQRSGENVFFVAGGAAGFSPPRLLRSLSEAVSQPVGVVFQGAGSGVYGIATYAGNPLEMRIARMQLDGAGYAIESRTVAPASFYHTGGAWGFELGGAPHFAWSDGGTRLRVIEAEAAFGEAPVAPTPLWLTGDQQVAESVFDGGAGSVAVGGGGEHLLVAAVTDHGFLGTGIGLAAIGRGEVGFNTAVNLQGLVPSGPYGHSLAGIAGRDGQGVCVYLRWDGGVGDVELWSQRFEVDAAGAVRAMRAAEFMGPVGGRFSRPMSLTGGIVVWPEGAEVCYREGEEVIVAWIPWDRYQTSTTRRTAFRSTAPPLLSRRGEDSVLVFSDSAPEARTVSRVSWRRGEYWIGGGTLLADERWVQEAPFVEPGSYAEFPGGATEAVFSNGFRAVGLVDVPVAVEAMVAVPGELGDEVELTIGGPPFSTVLVETFSAGDRWLTAGAVETGVDGAALWRGAVERDPQLWRARKP